MNGWIIGVIEDDKVQAALLDAMLARAQFTPLVYSSCQEFRRRNGLSVVDMLLLDWNLPQENGLDLLKELRAGDQPALPVILVTANQLEAQIVEGLNAGSDDYIVKPVRAAELVARIESVMRRYHSPHPAHEVHDPFTFITAQRRLLLHDKLLKTTPREFDLMLFLFRRPGKVIARDALLAEVWRKSASVSTRSIDTYISRLRRNFGLDGRNGWQLEGVYQRGYCLVRTHSDEE
ncbi:response regulator transcription factor [Kineobactrum salinum]|uniref:Response regulator transcription factor n=1 Tax=Kineobactrum salinum TaxID=2708301 RepID=A0A6C0U346_9GAMM|nr:response regulator transcription factor [Kineobactrum salinum]QIB66263.1 response regulator transcription factor [Kineobactrum salinum]